MKLKETLVATKELKKVVAELSEKLQEGITVNKTTGAGTASGDLYATTLPEGLTPDIVSAVSEHNTNFVAASVHAFGIKAVEALGENRNINQATIDIAMGGKDSLHITTVGETQLGEGKDSEFGTTRAVLSTHAGSNGLQLKTALKIVAEAASAALAAEPA